MVLSLDVAFENDGLFYAGEVFACTLTLTHNSPGSLGPAAVPATAGGGDGKRGLVLVNGLPVAHRKSMDLNWNALPPSSGSQESSTLAPVDASGPVASLRGILGATFSYLTGSSGTPEEAELEARPGSTSLNGKYYAPSRVLPEIGRRRKSHLTFTSQQPALVSSRRTSNAISPGIVPAQTKSSSPLLSEPVLVSQKRLGSVSELAVSTTKLHSETVASPDFGQEDPFSLPVMGLNAVPGGESNETPQKIQLEQQLTTLSLESGPDLPTPLSLAAPSTASSQPGHHIDPIGMDHKRHHLRDSATGRPPIPFSPAHNNATNHAASASSRPRASSVARSDMASSIGTSELLPTDHSFPHRSSKETLTHTEDIAWAFAQMTGHFAVEPSYMKTELLETLQSKVAYRVEGGGKGSVIGGGSLGLMNGTMSRPGSPADLKKETTKANPIFSTPPSILIADLSLPPGESKTVKYELILPSVLPPSYGGKVLRISYKLVVGVQKTDMTQKSFVVKIPFRLFNRTNDDGSRHTYEVMNPVILTRDEALVTPIEGGSGQSGQDRSQTNRLQTGLSSSHFNIQSLCQMQQRVSYDICKNNEHVAQLILLRAGFKLGESVAGVINFEASSIPCFQMSVYLETCEMIETPFSLRTKSQVSKLTRRIHGEYHKYTLNTKRTSFLLAIPILGSPDFQTTAMSLQWQLRFEFITATGNELYTTLVNGDGNFLHYQGTPAAQVDNFDCVIPIRVYGLRAGVSRRKQLHFDVK